MAPGPTAAKVGRAEFAALGGLAVVLTTDPEAIEHAAEAVRAEVAAIDKACSRFRDDSDLSRVNADAGQPVEVGPLFAEALAAALWAARITDGDVDPLCGASVRALGYDMDFADLVAGPVRTAVARAGARWTAVIWDATRSTVRIPAGTALDFGATAKALAADRAAGHAAAAAGCGVLVSLSGDIAVRGPAPEGGWHVRVTDDHRSGEEVPGQTVVITEGGLATSSTTVRAWQIWSDETASQRITVHHIVDPRTGRPTDGAWRTASVASASCLDANVAATASIVRGHAAAEWLARMRVPARLVHVDGSVVTVGGWPADSVSTAAPAISALPQFTEVTGATSTTSTTSTTSATRTVGMADVTGAADTAGLTGTAGATRVTGAADADPPKTVVISNWTGQRLIPRHRRHHRHPHHRPNPHPNPGGGG
ncbi:FAD:protein FMN transferase [Catenulispora sp. NL8]|uniref:FAD:protein FMN transferase n=1 Tax=Catenulispora pinistramenti TaxID=2705254 RepID=A0ABS5L729_9ACTN|nr:FAD:protein FMN transferase [Catenulispora pinistramenti]MBS2554014.1 FAD:protein FMN transferase [Catenulispora pinistramenti]